VQEKKWKIKGIIFDLDGTIVDSREAYTEAVRKAFSAIGMEIDEKMAVEIPRRLEQGFLIDDLVGKENAEKFLDVYLKTYYAKTADKTRLFPNVRKTLEEISKKAKLALITMRYVPKNKVIEELKKFGIIKYFQTVITALSTKHPKPSPEVFIKCAEKLNVKTGECMIVGDSVVDVRAGKKAGMKTVAVLSGIFTKEELEREKPDLILDNINFLTRIL